MVYEYLPLETDCYPRRINKEVRYIIETTRAITAILQTCHVIYNEAKQIIRKNMATAASMPPRMTITEYSREIGLDICCLIHDLHDSTFDMDGLAIISKSRPERNSTIFPNLAFSKTFMRMLRSWPRLEIVLPTTGVASEICRRKSLFWYFFLRMECLSFDYGLEVVVCIRRNELGERGEELLRKILIDSGFEIAIKMLDDGRG
jgi:hypothetical protein